MPNNTNVTYQEATFDFSDGWIIHHSQILHYMAL